MFTSALIALVLAVGATPTPAAEQMLWFRDGRLRDQAAQLLDAMHDSEAFGLEPRDYALPLPADEMTAVLGGRGDVNARHRFDAAMTKAVSRFVGELHSGRIDPRTAGFSLPTTATRTFDVSLAVRELASSTDVAATLAAIEPPPVPYRRLKTALARYRVLAVDPQLVKLPSPAGRSVAPGGRYDGASQLRRLLAALGDLPAGSFAVAGDESLVDAQLVAAIQRFQHRHGLAADGVIGGRTFAALTMPFDQRVQQIELSMERWRWLSAFDRPDIVVNIPQFVLLALPHSNDASAEPLEMRVIVGETYPHTRTPVFTTAINQVVFQPYWDVPASILHRELLPRIRKDLSFLQRYAMEIVQGDGDDARVMAPTASAVESLATGHARLRQRPGPRNALGPVKFLMPNPFNVYLHGTPEQALFERSQRTFSHGCIRVSEPALLAAYVLRNALEDWTEEAIDAAMCGTKTLRVRLERPVSVVVFYSTAMATASEGVLFLDDVYGLDRKLQQLLDSRHADALH